MPIRTFIGKDTESTDPADTRITYAGCVLQEYERNGYDDSDFYAIVWDEESQSIKHVCYATTRGWTYRNGCSIDVTPENLAKAQAHRWAMNLKHAIAAHYDAARDVYVKGKRVVSVSKRARKVKCGTEGEVIWLGYERDYGYNYRYSGPPRRIGIRTDDGEKFFAPAAQFVVVNPEQYDVSDEDIAARLRPADQITNFHVATPGYVNMVG